MTVSIAMEGNIGTNESPQRLSDDLLVSAAKSGDTNAFVELSKRYSRKLLQCSYRITRNRQDAEDVLQDSLLKAFLHLKDFEARSSFSSWITQIVINTSLMILRKKRGRFYIPLDSQIDDSGNCDHWAFRNRRESPEGHFARRETEQMLRLAILRLPRPFREVVQLRQAKEYSARELAQALGISVPAVKSRLSRARRALRASLREEFGDRMVWDKLERSNDRTYGVGRFASSGSSWNAGDFIRHTSWS